MKILTFLLTPKLFNRCSSQEKALCLRALKKCAAEGFSRGAKLEALQGGQYYSMRINQKARLLLVRDSDRADVFYVARALMNHEYDKALRESQSYHFPAAQELVVEVDEHQVAEEADVSAVAEHIIQETDRYFSYYRGDFITLTSDQQETVNRLHFPFIVSGAPGSGKSLIALEILKQRIESHQSLGSDQPIHLLYVTKSKRLASAQEALFEERRLLDMLSLPDNISCHFKTFDQLYQERYGDQLLQDEKAHCLTWLKEHIVLLNKEIEANNKVSTKDKKRSLLPDADVFYQEFQLLSRFLVQADEEARNNYVESTMGAYDSYFYQDRMLREKALVLFDNYRASLGAQVHTQFHPLNSAISYDMVLVDESQDVSLYCLYSQLLASNGNVVFLHGPHQNLGSNLNFTRLLSEIGGRHQAMPIHHLPVAFRNSQAVSYFLNAMLQCKYQLTGGVADKDEFHFMAIPTSKPVGEVVWKTAEQGGLLRYADNTYYAILYHAEQKEALIRDFNGYLPVNAYTIEESKGLEFKQVFLWRPFSQKSALLMDANSRLSKVVPYILENPHAGRAKDKSEIQIGFNTLMDGLFVASSRAIESLVIYEESKPMQRHMADYFKQAVGVIRQKITATDQHAVPAVIEETEAAIMDWAQGLLRTLDTANEKDIRQRIQQKIDQLRLKGKAKLAQALSDQLPVIHSLPQVEKIQPRKTGRKKKNNAQTVIHAAPVASSSATSSAAPKASMGLKVVASGSQVRSSKPETQEYRLVKTLLSGTDLLAPLSNIVSQGKYISVLLEVFSHEKDVLYKFMSLFAGESNQEVTQVFENLVDKALETGEGAAKLISACDERNVAGWSLWMVAAQFSPVAFKKLVDKALEKEAWTAKLISACDEKTKDGASLWMLAARYSPATFEKLVDKLLERGEWTAELISACDEKNVNGWSLWMVAARYSPAAFEKLVDKVLETGEGAAKLISACDERNVAGWSLWMVAAQFSPVAFKKLVDKALEKEAWTAKLISACDEKDVAGSWSLWMVAVRYSPAAFEKLVDKALERGEWTAKLISACDEKNVAGRSLWMVAAWHSPAAFEKLVDKALETSEWTARLISACDEKGVNGWSLWMMAARYRPAAFEKLVDKALETSEGAAKLISACKEEAEGGMSLWKIAALQSPAAFGKLVNKQQETESDTAYLIKMIFNPGQEQLFSQLGLFATQSDRATSSCSKQTDFMNQCAPGL